MGCFSYKCTASGLPIQDGDECYVVPLHMHPHGHKYSPIAPPIKGVYNDYGDIEDIQENENTRALEAYFGGSIDSILKVFGSVRGRDRGFQEVEYNGCGELMEHFGPKIDWHNWTRKDLIKLGFEIDQHNWLCHPQIKSNWCYLVQEVKGETVIVAVDSADGIHEKTTRDLDRILNEISKRYVFGVSKDIATQQKMRMLNDGKVSYIRADVYEKWIQLEPYEDLNGDTPEETFHNIKTLSESKEDPFLLHYTLRDAVEHSCSAGLFWNPFLIYKGHWCRRIFGEMLLFNRFYKGLVVTNGKLDVDNMAGLQYCEARQHLRYAKINLKILQKLAKKEAEIMEE